MKIKISPEGRITAIYTEDADLVGLMERLGSTSIRRASEVEPTPDNQWTADMKLMDGPVLGPFPQRSEALAAETAWLNDYLSSPG